MIREHNEICLVGPRVAAVYVGGFEPGKQGARLRIVRKTRAHRSDQHDRFGGSVGSRTVFRSGHFSHGRTILLDGSASTII